MEHTRSEINITSREKQVLRLIAREYNTAEISSLLQISKRTVETHRKNINRKANVRSLAGLTKYAIKLGLLNDFGYLPALQSNKLFKARCLLCNPRVETKR